MLNGILLVDKEAGITSYDVIRKLKKIMPRKTKLGHAGTLDPFATGLMIILIGRGTKLSNQLMSLDKMYEVVAEFGYETDTQDPTGEVTNKVETVPVIKSGVITEHLARYIGEIEQMPPQFSAKKVNGKKAYEFARKGKEVKLKAKRVIISKYEVIDYDWPKVSFMIKCSSGTYVRTLVRDLGVDLKTFATSVELRRTEVGPYSVLKSVKSNELSLDGIQNSIISIDDVKSDLDER